MMFIVFCCLFIFVLFPVSYPCVITCESLILLQGKLKPVAVRYSSGCSLVSSGSQQDGSVGKGTWCTSLVT